MKSKMTTLEKKFQGPMLLNFQHNDNNYKDFTLMTLLTLTLLIKTLLIKTLLKKTLPMKTSLIMTLLTELIN